VDWKHLLTYLTGTVDQELRVRNEYLVTENRILRQQIKGRIHLSDGERKRLAEIGKKLGKQALEEVKIPAACCGDLYSSGPVRLRSSRVCTRHVTISISTGPFSPSRTVNRLYACRLSAFRHSVTDCHGDFGRRPRPWYAGNGASRSQIVVVQGTPST